VMSTFWRSRYFVVGALLLLFGTGPLLIVIGLAKLGFTEDPNPNPVGFGILAMFTFWPGIVLIVLGILTSMRRRA
jgi:Na+/melibiose symporter-like transporter